MNTQQIELFPQQKPHAIRERYIDGQKMVRAADFLTSQGREYLAHSQLNQRFFRASGYKKAHRLCTQALFEEMIALLKPHHTKNVEAIRGYFRGENVVTLKEVKPIVKKTKSLRLVKPDMKDKAKLIKQTTAGMAPLLLRTISEGAGKLSTKTIKELADKALAELA